MSSFGYLLRLMESRVQFSIILLEIFLPSCLLTLSAVFFFFLFQANPTYLPTFFSHFAAHRPCLFSTVGSWMLQWMHHFWIVLNNEILAKFPYVVHRETCQSLPCWPAGYKEHYDGLRMCLDQFSLTSPYNSHVWYSYLRANKLWHKKWPWPFIPNLLW